MKLSVCVIVAMLVIPAALSAQGSLCKPTLAPRAAPPQVADMDFNPVLPAAAFGAAAIGDGVKR